MIRLTFACSLGLLLALARAKPQNCGPPLGQLIEACGQPDKAEPQFCCDALREFNAKQCWCQNAARFAASQLATNAYAFSARVSYCGIKNPFRPSIPSKGSPGLNSTCPKFPWEPTEITSTGSCSAPHYWRTQRRKTLDKLDNLFLKNRQPQTVSAFKKFVGNLFVDNVAFGSIGLLMLRGKEKTVDYLVSRQSAAGSHVPWSSTTPGGSREGLSWARSILASYEKTYYDGDSFLARQTFVTFAPCSAKIQELYVAENFLFNAIGAQFYYPDFPDPYTQFNLPASEICDGISSACGEKSPYKSKPECVAFMKTLRKSGKAMCFNYNKARLSPRAAVGDTVACRVATSLMAVSNPDKYCPLLGKVAGGMCTSKMCPAGDYGNLFSVKNPRYVGSGGFSCNSKTGDCAELWP
ncbi:hypothetical protein FGB62_2g363 [Gracilaria domingensis]|nr:hypothetical protein FGB62_2g363 [Gracilaria domingensis]